MILRFVQILILSSSIGLFLSAGLWAKSNPEQTITPPIQKNVDASAVQKKYALDNEAIGDVRKTDEVSKTQTGADVAEVQEKFVFEKFEIKEASSDQEKILRMLKWIDKINLHLISMTETTEDDDQINELLSEKTELINELMILLHRTTVDNLPPVVSRERLNFLVSRISINRERGNNLAVIRDQIQQEYYIVEQNIRNFVMELASASKHYLDMGAIKSIIQEYSTRYRQQKQVFEIPDIKSNSKVFRELKKNHKQLIGAEESYKDLLNFVESNPGIIASTHWFQYITLNTSITFFNSFEIARRINQKLMPTKLDIGGITTSLLIFSVIYFSFPVLFRCANWCIEKYLLDDVYSGEEIFYEEMRKPVRYLLIFVGIDMGAYALLYRTDFRSSLESISFIIYALIYTWLLFKVLDCLVLMQVQRMTRLNKQLRKDLFNLAVQVGKGLIVLIGIAVILSHFGISIVAIMSTLGIGGLAFALAAKDTLSNLFGGVTVLLDNVFKMGDWIKIGDKEGTVAEIGLRSTTIRTFDNALVTIPNSIISVSSVINWNRRAVGRRIKMYVGVTYESNMDDIRNALADLRNMLMEHPKIANPKQKIGGVRRQFRFSSHEDTQGIKSTQLVFLDRYSDYSIDILIYCFSRSVDWSEWLEVKEDVLFKIAEILKKNNLEFAYPTQVNLLKEENPFEPERHPDPAV